MVLVKNLYKKNIQKIAYDATCAGFTLQELPDLTRLSVVPGQSGTE